MDAVPLGEGLPMASCRHCNIGIRHFPMAAPGNATLGLRAGGRGHHLFFFGPESVPGTLRTRPSRRSMSAYWVKTDSRRTFPQCPLLIRSRRHELCESRAEKFLARPLNAWPFANVLATSRAYSVKSLASGLRVRFLSAMIPIDRCVIGNSTGNSLIDA